MLSMSCLRDHAIPSMHVLVRRVTVDIHVLWEAVIGDFVIVQLLQQRASRSLLDVRIMRRILGMPGMLWHDAAFLTGIFRENVPSERREVHGGLEGWRGLIVEVVRADGRSRRRSAGSG